MLDKINKAKKKIAENYTGIKDVPTDIDLLEWAWDLLGVKKKRKNPVKKKRIK